MNTMELTSLRESRVSWSTLLLPLRIWPYHWGGLLVGLIHVFNSFTNCLMKFLLFCSTFTQPLSVHPPAKSQIQPRFVSTLQGTYSVLCKRGFGCPWIHAATSVQAYTRTWVFLPRWCIRHDKCPFFVRLGEARKNYGLARLSGQQAYHCVSGVDDLHWFRRCL